MTVRGWYIIVGLFIAFVLGLVGREVYLKFRAPRFECRKDQRVCFVNICSGEAAEDVECFNRDVAYCYEGHAVPVDQNCFPTVDECAQRMTDARNHQTFADEPRVPVQGARCTEIRADEIPQR